MAAKRGLGKLGAMKVANPGEWERQIREAMSAADGRVPEAAEVLGCSTRHLWRWLSEDLFVDVPRAKTGRRRDG